MLITPFAMASIQKVGDTERSTKFNVLENSPGRDAAGYKTIDNWTAVAGGPFHGSISRHVRKPVEGAQAGQMVSITEFKLRFRAGAVALNPSQRIQEVGGPTYEIIGVDEGRTDPLQTIVDMDLAK